MIAQNERRKAEEEAEKWNQMLRGDGLTGLLSYNAFVSDVEAALLEGRRVLMLAFEVGQLTAYNARYGYEAGNSFLILIAGTIAAALRSDDLVCRMDGDGFAAALRFDSEVPQETMERRARQIFEKVNSKIHKQEEMTSLSMGAAFSNEEAPSFRKLSDHAGKALKRAEEKGGSEMVFYENEG